MSSPFSPKPEFTDDLVADFFLVAPAVMRQASLAKRMVNAGLHSVTGLPAADLARRPFLLFWFMSQIERCVLMLNFLSFAFPSLMFATPSRAISDTSVSPCADAGAVPVFTGPWRVSSHARRALDI